MQQGGEIQKINDQDDDVKIAMGFQFEQLQARHQREQRGSGGQAVEGAELRKQQCDRHGGDAQSNAARRGASPACRQHQANRGGGAHGNDQPKG